MRALTSLIGYCVGAALCVVTAATPVAACGGTFCDNPPPGRPPMPVDQTGENVLFVLDGGHVEAHVQIQYSGDPERFAWLVPVPAVPDVSVGSNALFLDLLNATVPTFSLSYQADLCSGGSVRSPGCGFAMGGMAADSSGGLYANGGGNQDRSHHDVVEGHETVGPFDVTILTPRDAGEVDTWLSANGFLNTPDAPELLQDYIDRGHVFVAVKLVPGAGVNEIQPLVIRYEGTEPCIPLKLTRIAAKEDMGVRAFFLGEHRFVPTGYTEVTLNPAQLDWPGLGANYTAVVSRAVDDPGGNGHAFLTEYAGDASVVPSVGLADARWNTAAFTDLPAEQAVKELTRQGFLVCDAGGCSSPNPLVPPLVRRYLPAPAGVSEREFYTCQECFAAWLDPEAWNGAAFAAELEERVVAPARHAAALLASHPYLTRLFTTISPLEMTVDPTFAETTGPRVDVSPQLSAVQHSACGGDLSIDGTAAGPVAMDGAAMPSFLRDMPWALRVTSWDTAGKPTLVYDNATKIQKRVEAWNETQGFPHPAPRSSDSSGGACSVGNRDSGPGPWLAALLGIVALRLGGRGRRSRAR